MPANSSEGFDFELTGDGELKVDCATHEPGTVTDVKGKIQLSVTRIKSVAKNWFYDNAGADLEQIVGRPCTPATAEVGRKLIRNSLTENGLWEDNQFYIKSEIRADRTIVYQVYFKIYQNVNEKELSYSITVEMDLIRGVKVRYGWKGRDF